MSSQKNNQLQMDERCKVWLFALVSVSGGYIFAYTFIMFNNFFPFFVSGKFGDQLAGKDLSWVHSGLNSVYAVGMLVSALTSSIFFKWAGRHVIFTVNSLCVVIASVLQVFVGLELFFVCRFVQGYCAAFHKILGIVMIKEYLLKEEIGRFGAIMYLFMCSGYISVFYLKYDWTATYWYLIILFPALFESIRIALFYRYFFFDSPVSNYNFAKKEHDIELSNTQFIVGVRSY